MDCPAIPYIFYPTQVVPLMRLILNNEGGIKERGVVQGVHVLLLGFSFTDVYQRRIQETNVKGLSETGMLAHGLFEL